MFETLSKNVNYRMWQTTILSQPRWEIVLQNLQNPPSMCQVLPKLKTLYSWTTPFKTTSLSPGFRSQNDLPGREIRNSIRHVPKTLQATKQFQNCPHKPNIRKQRNYGPTRHFMHPKMCSQATHPLQDKSPALSEANAPRGAGPGCSIYSVRKIKTGLEHPYGLTKRIKHISCMCVCTYIYIYTYMCLQCVCVYIYIYVL